MNATSNARTFAASRSDGSRRRERLQLAATGAVFLFVAAVIAGLL